MDFKKFNQGFGFLVLLITLVVYTITAQESVPFWDCAEFSASAVWQQVPHPPGAPLFLMIGKLFHLVLFWGDPGWAINMVSVVATAFTSFFLYHVIVMAINFFRSEEIKDMATAISVAGSGFVGSLAYTFSDTVWFNGVESEVYAMATLFVALVVYLMMKWLLESDKPGHERYIMLIAYVIGLSIGVQLLAILPIFSIVFLVALKKYPINFKNFIITSLISLAIFFVVYPFIVKWIPALLAGHSPTRNEAREYAFENSDALKYLAVAGIASCFALFYYFRQKKSEIPSLVFGSICLIILGYTTYTQILIRSNSNPPMNENAPKTFTQLSSYLGREQYGDDPSWPRRVKNEEMFIQNYRSQDESGEYIYGPWNPPSRIAVTRKDGNQVPKQVWDDVNVMGELKYLVKYQSYHMFVRYLLWNYVGRSSDEQDAGFAFVSKDEANKLNVDNGYKDLFPIRFFGIPLFLGLIGMFFYFKKDPKNAFVFLVMFGMMGVLAAIAQQQQDPQPRERDYFYTGAFFIWCFWIGLGVYAIFDTLKEKMSEPSVGLAGGLVLATTLLVPANMAIGGWDMHDRSGNFIPFDYSYNILQSVDENAVLFTNGDNDTFPLWYLQDVMGVRRDVRIVNLSLGNTLWYVDQLKNRKPWGAEKLPLNFSDESMRVDEETDTKALSYEFVSKDKPVILEVPVRKEILAKYTKDSAIINKGIFKTQFVTSLYDQDSYLLKVQDKVIKDIIVNSKFERPMYFANTMGSDAFAGLDRFLRLEGMAWRLCPVEQKNQVETGDKPVDIATMDKCLLNIDNTENFSTTPKFGFKLRNLNNMKVYYDPVHRRLTNTYRSLYLGYAGAVWATSKDKAKVEKILNILDQNISTKQFPMNFDQAHKIALLYDKIGNKAMMLKYCDLGIASASTMITFDPKNQYIQFELRGQMYGPNKYAADMMKMKGDFGGARQLITKLLAQQKALSTANRIPENETEYLYRSIIELEFKIDELAITDTKVKKGVLAAIKQTDDLLAQIKANFNGENAQKMILIIYFRDELSKEAGVAYDKEGAIAEMRAKFAQLSAEANAQQQQRPQQQASGAVFNPMAQ